MLILIIEYIIVYVYSSSLCVWLFNWTAEDTFKYTKQGKIMKSVGVFYANLHIIKRPKNVRQTLIRTARDFYFL